MNSRLWLINAREERQLTQQHIADLVGISRAHYTNIEIGLRIPSYRVAQRIGKALEIDWTMFFPNEENVS